MAVDLKYGRVELERGTIGDDEPVFVFRAQDRLLPDVLRHYRQLCADAGSPDRHLDAIDRALHAIAEWQETHHTQIPQSSTVQGV